MRNTKEVFESHLELRWYGKVEEDLQQNYHPDVVLLTNYGVFRGHDGVRKSAKILEEKLGDGKFIYSIKYTCGDIAYLEWKGESETVHICDGADTFLIKDGKIHIQTIHYLPHKK